MQREEGGGSALHGEPANLRSSEHGAPCGFLVCGVLPVIGLLVASGKVSLRAVCFAPSAGPIKVVPK